MSNVRGFKRENIKVPNVGILFTKTFGANRAVINFLVDCIFIERASTSFHTKYYLPLISEGISGRYIHPEVP